MPLFGVMSTFFSSPSVGGGIGLILTLVIFLLCRGPKVTPLEPEESVKYAPIGQPWVDIITPCEVSRTVKRKQSNLCVMSVIPEEIEGTGESFETITSPAVTFYSTRTLTSPTVTFYSTRSSNASTVTFNIQSPVKEEKSPLLAQRTIGILEDDHQSSKEVFGDRLKSKFVLLMMTSKSRLRRFKRRRGREEVRPRLFL
jgi:hypothetical protein